MIYCVGSPSACTQADTGRSGPASAHHTSILSLSYIPIAPSDSHGCSLYCIFVHFFLILSGKCQGCLLAAGRSDMVSLFADGRTTGGRGSSHPSGQPDRQPDSRQDRHRGSPRSFRVVGGTAIRFPGRNGVREFMWGAALVLTGLRLFFFLHCTAYPGYGILKRV